MAALLPLMIRLNGWRWTMYVVLYVLIRKIKPEARLAFLDRKIKHIESSDQVPGMNALELNKKIWENWNWRRAFGEEWTWSANWKASLIDDVMDRFIKPGGKILEIGPGGGKWSIPLSVRAKKLILLDISAACLEICREKFADSKADVSFVLGDGMHLSGIEDASVDYIWSFDVFVHIAPEDINSYFQEMKRVLRPGGIAIIHHADEGGIAGGWRSSLYRKDINNFLEQNGLHLVDQFDSWGEGGQYHVRYYNDLITVFSQPG